MSRSKISRRNQVITAKSRVSKLKRKTRKKDKKRNERKSSNCDKNKNPKNDEENKRKGGKDDLVVKKIKVVCTRYEKFHENFLSYDEILKFLEKTRKAHLSAVDIIKIGNSVKGKPIYMVQITSSFSATNSPKMAVFIESGLNGENAFAISNALFMIEYLVNNPNFTKIMDYFIVPCSNPDAYDDYIKNKENSRNKSGSNYCHLGKKKSDIDINKGDKISRCESPKKSRNSNKNTSGDQRFNKKHSPMKINKSDTRICQKIEKQSQKPVGVDLSLNFPVILGLNDMSRIPTASFLDKIKLWKENFIQNSPETRSLVSAIYNYQFSIKLLISLQEGGEAICYPYGFCAGVSQETSDLIDIAKKGKCGINGRNFEYGSVYDIQGLTYGTLLDFLKVDKSSIKYTYMIKVHKKTPRYNEKEELKHLMRYGREMMECVKRMSCAVYKRYTDMTGNKKVETEKTKFCLDRKFPFI